MEHVLSLLLIYTLFVYCAERVEADWIWSPLGWKALAWCRKQNMRPVE